MEKLWSPSEEGDDFLINAILECPAAEALKMGLYGDMNKSILKGRGHTENGRTIFGAIARSPYVPSLGQSVGTDFAVEYELLCDTLDGGRGHI